MCLLDSGGSSAVKENILSFKSRSLGTQLGKIISFKVEK